MNTDAGAISVIIILEENLNPSMNLTDFFETCITAMNAAGLLQFYNVFSRFLMIFSIFHHFR